MFVLPTIQFAVANDTDYTFAGILGLGYASSASMSYPPILEWLNHEKLINAKIFSIGLGSDGDEFCKCEGCEQLFHGFADKTTGEIVFGGVNKYHYAGYLEPVPIWPPVKEQRPTWIQ